MFNSNTMTPADLAAVTKNDDSAWGGNGIWWIILLFLVFGMGGNGWNNNSGAADNYVLASDFATLQRQIDNTASQTQNLVYQNADQLQRQVTAIGNGISSLGYDQLSQFNSVNTNVLQSANAIQSDVANCCCSNKMAIADVNYNMATQANGITSALNTGFCQTNYNNSNNTRDIVESGTANTQAILAKLNQMESNAQADKIATLQAENNNLRLLQSQADQNAYLLSRIVPSPSPAYVVSSPYASNYNGCGCGCTA